VIRPIILFGETVTARSQQVEMARTTVGEKAQRFVQHGMLGLAPSLTKTGRPAHVFPHAVADYIVYLKQIYPPLHLREIVRILDRHFGYKTNHHRVQRFLEEHPVPAQMELDFTPFHAFEDAYQARWLVVQMHWQGWNKKSIAGCLQLSRAHVYRILEAYARDDFAGLEDQRYRPADHPKNQLSLPLLKDVLTLQKENPRLGRTRLRGLLARKTGHRPPGERTLGRAMRLNRQFHGAPDPWPPTTAEGILKHLPFRPQHRHHYWFIDIRYLVKLADGWVYSICILEGYSRKILAGMVSEYQDLTAVLQLVTAALAEYGCPDALVSDNGSVFKAHDYERLLEALEVKVERIEKGKPWQSLLEAQFKIQWRLLDPKLQGVDSLEKVQSLHAEFIELFNSTPHWAHRQRDEERQSPETVLNWVRGRVVPHQELQRLLRTVRFVRTVNRFGFVSVQRFYLYAEQGLARRRVAIWIYEHDLRIEYQATLLAEYDATSDRRRRLQAVTHPVLHRTPFVSPQLVLFELDDEQWQKIRRRAYLRRVRYILPEVQQLALVSGGSLLIWIALLLLEDELHCLFPHV
jgi:putative transposase